MLRLLAIEWGATEARIALATSRAGGATIDDAFVVALPPRAEGTAAEVAVGDAIASAVAERHLGRVEALAAVGRAGIELKQLTLPPAPDDELPDLVRFQALRDFHSLADDWPLDFIPLAGPPDAPRQVLAAAVAPDLVKQIRETCLRAKIAPEKLILRPCAAASLLTRARWDAVAKVKLLVDLLAEDADLTVLVDNEVVFLRTVRLSGDLVGASGQTALIGEIRRTVAAARNQTGGLAIEAIYLCASGEQQSALAAQLETQLGIPTHVFNPFSGLHLSSSLQRALPASPGRFAPVLGMLLDEAEGRKHALDFLNPRRRPPPPSRRRAALWAAAVAIILFAAGYTLVQTSLGEMDDRLEKLTKESKNLDKVVTKAKELQQSTGEIAAWADTDVNWLDELRELSLDMPPAREVLLSRLNMNLNGNVGQIDLEGLLRVADSANNLEAALRDNDHSVQGRSLQQDASREGYSWKFTSTIAARPESREGYQKRAEAIQKKKEAAGEEAIDGT